MRIDTEYPFDTMIGWVIRGSDGRMIVCLMDKASKARTTTSLARYRMSVKERRILGANEHVDHIDGDKTNDSIDNLQILSMSKNSDKYIKQAGVSRAMIEMRCPGCGGIFKRRTNQSHRQKGGRYSVCSKPCLYLVSSMGLSLSDLSEIGRSQVLREFREPSK